MSAQGVALGWGDRSHFYQFISSERA